MTSGLGGSVYFKCINRWVTRGYFRNPAPEYAAQNAEFAGKFHDGWLLTGDVASIDPECRLAIRDRSKPVHLALNIAQRVGRSTNQKPH